MSDRAASILNIKENVPLAPFTTLGVGGAARYFGEVANADGLRAGVEWAQSRALPIFILGGGSNIVVADSGFAGLVLHMRIRGIETRIESEAAIVSAGAGEVWDDLVTICATQNWAGVECLSGIPGYVGATPMQNVGAYGQETSETLVRLEAFDLLSRQLVTLNNAECDFGYRTSRFKTTDRDRFIITQVTYRLRVGGEPQLRYAELEAELARCGVTHPTAAQVREAVIAIRRRKAMVIDASDADSRSVGSFFINPVVTQAELEAIKMRAAYGAERDKLPSFATSEGKVKLSAAWLIEQAGLRRGTQRGAVGISHKHALALTNRGGATAREVLELADEIKARVRDAFGVELRPEPVFVGFAFNSSDLAIVPEKQKM